MQLLPEERLDVLLLPNGICVPNTMPQHWYFSSAQNLWDKDLTVLRNKRRVVCKATPSALCQGVPMANPRVHSQSTRIV